MATLLRFSNTSFEHGLNADVTTSVKCKVTSTAGQTVVHTQFFSNADKITLGIAGSSPACHTEKVWQNILSNFVEN